MKLVNPIGFTRGPVTIITTTVYVALITALIILHVSVPVSPRSSPKGVNLTEAWHDLQTLTTTYHPYNSRENSEVHRWLLTRIEAILTENKAAGNKSDREVAQAIVFEDNISNLTFSSQGSVANPSGISVYFESTNIIVYVRGSNDDDKDWWKDAKGHPRNRKGVLVNAHYDSVSTGYGATDDGVGVISILQLLRYWTTPGNTPRYGLVLLLNNGEEDFLNGANVFSQHPMSKFPGTFLNLEGAGAGGKAFLFRSTDTEVTKAYARAKYPSGTVITGDGFERGFIRSQTDYVVFNGKLGMRGLDVAFVEPRARYHTGQDDAKHTGIHSLWHMLSAAIATTKQLTSSGIEESDNGTSAVWFDLFGRVFAVFRLHSLFALSVTMLVMAPITLMATLAILYQQDKLYLVSGSTRTHTQDGDVPVRLDGWRGFFRFPAIFAVACAGPVALAYLVFKQNQFIVHSSEWAVWAMMFSAFIFVAWFLARAADFTRPSALTRAYGYSWMFAAWWFFLVIGTITETQYKLAGSYFILFYFATVFLVTWFSYLELFSLKTKKDYACCLPYGGHDHSRESSRARSASDTHEDAGEATEEEPTERSGLLGGRGRRGFKNFNQQHEELSEVDQEKEQGGEQDWARTMWSWTWLLQFLILAPNIIIIGQIGLLAVTSMHQTGSDGSSMFTVYLGIAIISILILSPLVPLVHRFSWPVPMFLFLVLIGTILYNLIAFPFSANNRLKLFFQQEIDLDTGANNVSLVGVTPYVDMAIGTIPSAAGQKLVCDFIDPPSMPGGRRKCSWAGVTPNVVPNTVKNKFTPSAKKEYRTWVSFNASRISSKSASFTVSGKNTRACKLQFGVPISSFHVHGQGPVDERFKPVPDAGSKEIRLWNRDHALWTVDVSWDEDPPKEIEGRVVCMWSNVNHDGVIPAYDEAMHFAPDWVAMTKWADGLVEGYKRFKI